MPRHNAANGLGKSNSAHESERIAAIVAATMRQMQQCG